MRYQCENLREKWPEYIYRELPESEQSLFVRHLEECSTCQAEEREWRNLFQRMDRIAVLDDAMIVPPELVYRVKRQVRLDEDWSKQFTDRFRYWMIGTSVACMLIVCGIGMIKFSTPIQPSPPVGIPITLQKSVLQSFYNGNTLKLYREEGIFWQNNGDSSHPIVKRNENESSVADRKKNPAS